ncbi:deoxynucleotidyltransferase terminal-interacting protein 2 [Denticeps clupeoides]|uniref:deoxynucleotidyltransferase terminal-interacting protein 2 n=1 Tax=Denticeps clupeoides TaxID=299321 RepID=UPI0010A4CAF2|nr:deoxynucleotidyltransferase terminal-interacting protein 2-like [Denticeps clupeoides]
MVATRRGVRVYSPSKTARDESPGTSDSTVSSARWTRSAALKEVVGPQLEQQGDPQTVQNEPTEEVSTSEAKPAAGNETRASTPQTVEVKVLDDTHEADVSESDSCCSTMSDLPHVSAARVPRSRRGRSSALRERAADEGSEVDSCSSAVPETPRRSSRSHRKNAATLSKALAARMLTRSQRKVLDASSKSHTEDTEFSGQDSCASSIQTSVVRRSRRARAAQPAPIDLEESGDAAATPLARRTPARRTKAASGGVRSCSVSEGFESGPSTRTTRSQAASRQLDPSVPVVDSDSDEAACSSMGSPALVRGRWTPCSSRTGSASSSRAVPERQTSLASAPESTDEEECNVTLTNAMDVEEMVEEGPESTVLEAEEDKETVTEDQSLFLEGENKGVKVVEPDEPDHTREVEAGSPRGPVTVSENTEGGSVDERKSPDEHGCPEEADLQENVAPFQKPDEDIEVENGEPEELRTADLVTSQETACEEAASSEDPTMEIDHHIETRIPGESEFQCLQERRPNISDEEEYTAASSGPDLGTVTITDYYQQDEPTVSSGAREPALVSLLDSSEDEDDSDVCSTGMEHQDSGSDDDVSSSNPIPPTPLKPKAKPQLSPADDLFAIDTEPGFQSSVKYYFDGKQKDGAIEDYQDEEFIDEDDFEEDEDAQVLFTARTPSAKELSCSIDPGVKVKELGGLYISFDGSKSKTVSNSLKKLKVQKKQDEIMKKSVIGPDFEKKDSVPPYKESKNAAKLKRREERAKTTGDGWYNMKAPEMTEELKNDLKVLQMRSAMDPKRFYKKNDREGFPKYVQVGTVVDSPVDFYHSRIPKKQRKRTIVEELLADAEFRSYNKKKYQEIMTERTALNAGKKHRKKNKFRKK